jgi:hypothetical protein
MGINNLAVQTFSSSGSQSVCRANKADSSTQISSDFIARCPVKYINGSGTTKISGSIRELPSRATGSINTETFKIPNNVDAISDMLLCWTVTIPEPSGAFINKGIYYSKTLLLDCIKKIEIKHGGLIIQTITPGDIYMRNYSELGTLIKSEDTFNKITDASYIDTGSIVGCGTDVGETLNFSLSIPFIGRNKTKNRSLIQTGTYTNILSVLVYYYDLSSAVVANAQFLPLLHTGGATSKTTIDSNLYILSHMITDTEKNFMKQNIVNRVLNTSVGLSVTNVFENKIPTGVITGTTKIIVDFDSVDINVTHIMFCLNCNIFQNGNSSGPRQFISTDVAGKRDVSFVRVFTPLISGARKLSSSWGEAGNDTLETQTAVTTTYDGSSAFVDASYSIINPDVLGVFKGWLESAELIIGNETTGNVSVSALNSSQEEFELKMCDKNFYILKLADNAFSTAGIPFSRIKNKTLVLNVYNKFFNGDVFGEYTPSSTYKRDVNIDVCVCGTTLQIINNNAVSFSYV